MDKKTIFTKTAKGLREASGKTSLLSRDMRNLLKDIDGKTSIRELLKKLDDVSDRDLKEALTELVAEDFIRELEQATPEVAAPTPRPMSPPPSPPPAANAGEDLDFTSLIVPVSRPDEVAAARARAEDELRQAQAAQAKKDAEEKARREAEARAKLEAEARAKAEAEARAKQQAEARAKAEAEARAKLEAEEKARREAEARAKQEAEAKAKAEMEARAKQQAEARAKAEAEARARQEAEEKARREAEARAKLEAEARAKKEAEEKARREAEERTRQEAEARAKAEAEARTLAEVQTRKLAEKRAQREAEERARQEAEANAKREAEERARQEAEENSRREAEERARQEAEVQAQAAAQAQREAEEKTRREAEEKSRREAEERARQEAEEKSRREAEERVRREAEAQAQAAAAAQAQREAEEKTRREAEEKSRREAEARARQEAEERARQEAEEKSRRETEDRARQEADAKAEREAEERERREAEERAEQAAEEHERHRAEERARREEQEARAHRELASAKAVKSDGGKSHSWGRLVVAALVALPVLGLALMHVISFDGKIPQMEKAAGALLQQPVKIASVHASMFPPHFSLGGVVVGDSGQIKAPRIRLATGIGAIFGGDMTFESLEVDSPVMTDEGLSWLVFSKASGQGVKAGKISMVNAKLNSSAVSLPAFSVKAETGGDGLWKKMQLEATDKSLTVDLTSQGETVQFEATASSFAVPFGSSLVLADFSATGAAGSSGITVSEFKNRLHGGLLTGSAKLKWGQQWSLEGALVARQIDTAQFLPGLLEGDKLEGKASYAMRAGEAAKLFSALRLDGTFVFKKGVLLGVDLGRMLQSGDSGGKTEFSEIAGSFVHERGLTQLQSFRLSAGNLSASGSADVDGKQNIRGRLAVDLRMPAEQRRASISMSGTSKAVVWSRR